MADEVTEEWKSEPIPREGKEATLFMRVHVSTIKPNGTIMPVAFTNHGGADREPGMSTDWIKYAETPGYTQNGHPTKPAGEYTVISLIAGPVGGLPDQRVKHTPDIALRNRAHTDVFGQKTLEVQNELIKMAEWEIKVACQDDLWTKIAKQAGNDSEADAYALAITLGLPDVVARYHIRMLSERGFIEITRTDERSTFVRLTQKGKRRLGASG